MSILTSALTGMLTASRRLTPSLAKLSPVRSDCVSASSDNLIRARFRRARHERAGVQYAVSRVARTRKRLGADKLLLAQVDLRLKPELDPIVFQSFVEIDTAGGRRRIAQSEILEDLYDGAGLKRLLQRRQHQQPVLVADTLDVREHRRTAVRHQLHIAAVTALAERHDAADRFGRFQCDVEEDRIGGAAAQRREQALGRRRTPRCRCRRRA